MLEAAPAAELEALKMYMASYLSSGFIPSAITSTPEKLNLQGSLNVHNVKQYNYPKNFDEIIS